MNWTPTSTTRDPTGQSVYQIIITTPNGAKDVTYLRGIPTQITSYTFADPFGPSTAQIMFPQISIFEDLGVPHTALSSLLDFADITINLVTFAGFISYQDLVNDTTLSDFLQYYAHPVWEGYIASFEWAQDGTSGSLTLQCQGACFQVDQILAKPMYPPRPLAYENLIKDAFSRQRHPSLRTKPLKVEFYSGWDVQAPNYANTPSYLTPVGVTAGENITGYFGRSTGSWDKSLTSFVQGLLGVMLDSQNQQWTIRLDPYRQPVLYVRVNNPSPDYTISAGQPGVQLALTRDLTQYANVFYGQGTDQSGVEWDRQEVSANGRETAYAPLAFDPEVWPPVHQNRRYNSGKPMVEAYTKFDAGFDERQALQSAKTILARDMDPGVAGTITLTVDPTEAFMGVIKAGQSIRVKNCLGTGSRGMLFHISQADHDPINRSVSLTVDTKFRDLLTVDEVLARTRDPLTPVNMLKINSRQLLIQDTLAPWNYKKGAGFVPNNIDFFKDIPSGENFPFSAHSHKFSPKKHPHMYVKVKANAKAKVNRWTTVPIRLSEAGTIRLVQIAAYNEHGDILKIPFHFSIYYTHVTGQDMPYDNNGNSPFIPGAFESTNQFGEIIAVGTTGATALPQKSLIIGWGNAKQPAGYSPGAKTAGNPLTGMLIDEEPWQFTMTGNNPDFQDNVASGKREPESAYTAYGIFYAEYHDYVFFRGRMYRQEPGTS